MKNNTKIIGIDEVGRGCVAGPIVCASFAMDRDALLQICKIAKQKFQTESNKRNKINYERLTKLTYYDVVQTGKLIKKEDRLLGNLNFEIGNLELLSLVFDSKKVSEKNRKLVAEYLLHFGKWGIGVVSNSIIDTKGIQYSNKLAMLKSLSPHFTKYYEQSTKYFVLTDHLDPRGIDYKINKEFNFFTSDKMDSKSFVTASASIIAKVYRDILMEEYHNKFPQYGFKNHVGYGTSLHLEKIKEIGLSSIHRKSFLSNYLKTK